VIRAGHREELQRICTELNIPNSVESTDEWVKTERTDNAVLWTTDEMAPGVIPDVTGMTLRDAIYLLENMGLNVDHTGRGRVLTQSRLPGTKVPDGGGGIKLKLG